MSQNSDPYYTERVGGIQAAFLNYGQYVSSNPDIYTFSGNPHSFVLKAKQTDYNEISKYKSLRINITGIMIKGNNFCCYWNTVIWGSIFLFPLFFICCDWWKKKVNKIFSVSNQAYQALGDFISKSNCNDLYVMVQDNLFNEQKAQILMRCLQRSRVKNFVFNNVAVGFDYQKSNYSSFDKYMRPVKTLSMGSEISWGNKFVI